ncbi:hypothetical protein EG68_01044 [Paragonimus skrjabini miyazakii]|uniref:Uncharacterized protein n=1 Tax=Paragonimus skrjabini miyazakii TaxID=59628 RepID=A0A8S9Z7E8_9TREM|nr:hypothetical protein EG68_01044 [Paragonimus skrjabini miyazakii]
MFIGFLECITVGCVYGFRRLFADIEVMIGPIRSLTRVIWAALWVFVVPVFTLLMLITSCITFSLPVAPTNIAYPKWTVTLGWSFAAISLSCLPLVAIVMCVKHRCDPAKLLRPNNFHKHHVITQQMLHKERQEETKARETNR